MEQYFLKFIKDGKIVRQTIVDETTDVLGLRGIRLGGVVFDETNLVTVSGVNSLQTVSGNICDKIENVSGLLDNKIDAVSATSEFNDNYLLDLITGVSGSSDDNDDYIINLVNGVSGSSDDNDNFIISLITGVSGSSDDNDDNLFDIIFNVSGNLQGQIDAITSDKPREERFFVSGGQTLIDINLFTFDPATDCRDIKVYKNGNYLFMSETGAVSGEKTGGDWRKTSSSQIELLTAGRDGDKIVVRDERTGGGGGSGGGVSGTTDLENITVNTKPAVNGAVDLGSETKGWGCLFLKDVTNTDVYHVQVSGGVLLASLVP